MKTFLLLSALLTSSSLAAPATPSVLQWGKYTVTVAVPTSSGQGKTIATIREGQQILVTVRDQILGASLHPLRPGGLPELVLSGFSGGAHCCTTYTMFSQDTGHLENIGILDGGDFGATFKDLDRDGTREILYSSNAIASYDYSHAASPGLETVIGWDGSKLTDQTRKFSWIPWAASRSYQRELFSGTAPEMLRGVLGGYYGNMVLAGQGEAAEQYLQTTLFPKQPVLAAWFSQNRSGLINILHTVPTVSLHLSYSPTLPLSSQH